MRVRAELFVVLALLLLAGCQTGKRVVILVDGQRRIVETQAATVADVLRAEKIQLGDQDRVDPPGYAPIERTATIRIVRVEILTEKRRETVEFARTLTRDETLEDGKMRVIQLGVNGEEEVTEQVTREDGKEISRREINRTRLKEPRAEILVLGTQNALPVVNLRGTLTYLAHGNAWVIRNNSRDKRPLTFEGDLDGRVFDLSPDGRYLLFTRTDTQRLNSLWVADTVVLDEKPRRIPLDDLLYGQWAPDESSRIAYSTGEKTVGAPGWEAHNDLRLATLEGLRATLPVTTTVVNSSEISETLPVTASATISLTISTNTPITITTRTLVSPSVPTVLGWWGGALAWAPDANVFAYAFADQVGLINAATGVRQAYKSFALYNTRAEWVWTPQLTWSPDSRFVLATVHAPPEGAGLPEDSPGFDAWVFARDHSLALPLVRGSGMWASPAWSPADKEGESRIAYGVALNAADSERSTYALYVMNRDGSGRNRIFPQGKEPGLRVVQLAWSPDGGQLAAVRDGDVWVYDFAQGLGWPLTANGDSHLPRWK